MQTIREYNDENVNQGQKQKTKTKRMSVQGIQFHVICPSSTQFLDPQLPAFQTWSEFPIMWISETISINAATTG